MCGGMEATLAAMIDFTRSRAGAHLPAPQRVSLGLGERLQPRLGEKLNETRKAMFEPLAMTALTAEPGADQCACTCSCGFFSGGGSGSGGGQQITP